MAEESLDGNFLAIVDNGKSAPSVADLADGKLVPIVVKKSNGKPAVIEKVNRFLSLGGIIEPEIWDLPRKIGPPTCEEGPMVKSTQSSGILYKNISLDNKTMPAKRAKSPKQKKPKKPRTAREIASPLLNPKVIRKSLETRRRNAARKKAKAAQEKKERGDLAIANGGRVTKTGRIYEAESLLQ
jgi:hypothetical protein